MSDEKQETIADIIAAIRRWSDECVHNVGRYVLRRDAQKFADRIEAAWMREPGNVPSIRDALLRCTEIAIQFEVDEMSGVAGTTDKPEARSASEAIQAILIEIHAALSTPPRNCDIGSANEQEKRFDVWVRDRRGDLDCTGKCPAHNGVDFGVVNCVLQWAQMPYEEGGAE